jgi:hypothetical protein
VVKALLRP